MLADAAVVVAAGVSVAAVGAASFFLHPKLKPAAAAALAAKVDFIKFLLDISIFVTSNYYLLCTLVFCGAAVNV